MDKNWYRTGPGGKLSSEVAGGQAAKSWEDPAAAAKKDKFGRNSRQDSGGQCLLMHISDVQCCGAGPSGRDRIWGGGGVASPLVR